MSQNLRFSRLSLGESKGFVFTMDAAYAFYLVLVLMAASLAVFEYSAQSSEETLRLARLARDAYDIGYYNSRYAMPNNIPSWLKWQAGACNNANVVGAHSGVVYNANQVPAVAGDELQVFTAVVCIDGN